MNLSDFDYHLPQELIAAYPPEDRPSARLLSVNRKTGQLVHQTFRDIAQHLKTGDVLVLNNTKVLPARIFGKKTSGGQVEALLLKKKQDRVWEALIRPGKRIKKDMQITFGDNGLRVSAKVLDEGRLNSAERLLEFERPLSYLELDKIGHIPLPPYLNRPDSEIDRTMYQTVFAEKEGAVASPTAGLHFDENLLADLRMKGIETVFVTLHVGYGTFQTIAVENLAEHQMEEEEFEISQEAADRINRAKREGRRIIACGTTSVRTLESGVNPGGELTAQRSKTRLFVYPSYRFKMVEGLITNFHLPKSTLLLLVAAFLDSKEKHGRDRIFEIYAEAIQKNYRFYSYGDAMVIL